MKKYAFLHYLNLFLAQKSSFLDRFLYFLLVFQGKKVIFWRHCCCLIVEASKKSARRCIFSEGICLCRLFWCNCIDGWVISYEQYSPKQSEKNSRKEHFDPLWRHNHQVFAKNVIFAICSSRQKIWRTGSHALGVKHFGPLGLNGSLWWCHTTRLGSWCTAQFPMAMAS